MIAHEVVQCSLTVGIFASHESSLLLTARVYKTHCDSTPTEK